MEIFGKIKNAIGKAANWYKARNELIKFLVAIGIGYTFHDVISGILKAIGGLIG